MMKNKLTKTPVLLLAVAAILLLVSSVGSTQAALTYYSENYVAEVNVSNIGVTLLENETPVEGTLELHTEDQNVVPGKSYNEALKVKNSGAIDAYVRVIITKSWKNAEGKNTALSPKYIELNALTGADWVKDESASTPEREVYYYTKALSTGKETTALTDTFRINPAVAKELIQTTTDGIITYKYKYNGYQCAVEAEVDAVQKNNAADAIKSAWGVDVNVAEDGTLSLN